MRKILTSQRTAFASPEILEGYTVLIDIEELK